MKHIVLFDREKRDARHVTEEPSDIFKYKYRLRQVVFFLR